MLGVSRVSIQRSAVRVIAVRVTIGYRDIFLLAPNGLNYMNYLGIEWQLVSVTILSVPKGVTVTADHCMELTPLLSGEASSSVGESTNFLHLTANSDDIVASLFLLTRFPEFRRVLMTIVELR